MDYPSGWTCERAIGRFEFYLVDRLARSEALAVAEHLEACESCAGRLVLVRVMLERQPRG